MLLDLCVIHELYKENKIKITFQKSFLENILGLENIVEAYRYPTKFLSSSVPESESKPESERVKYSVVTLFIILSLTTYLFSSKSV